LHDFTPIFRKKHVASADVGYAPMNSASSDAVLRHIQGQARYLFTAAEFAKLTGRPSESAAVSVGLSRLAKQGKIALAMKRPAKWLIVPPEHEHYGAPPVLWWLDVCMKQLGHSYYVGLLSAARHWGSGHYAIQAVQVLVEQPRAPIRVGKLMVDFTAKGGVERTPVVRVATAAAAYFVSTREATLLDLLRHQSIVGGVEAVARIAQDFSRKLTPLGIDAALNSLNQVSAAQRLGFLLERIGDKAGAARVEAWLSGKRRPFVALSQEKAVGTSQLSLRDSRWNVEFLPSDETTILETK